MKLTKVRLRNCLPGQKVRMKPNTVTLEVDQHLHNVTRVKLKDEGFWRDSSDEVYLEQ